MLSSRFDAVPFLIENHDEAYHLWRKAGLQRCVLVHVDAHHDMWWLDDPGSLSIGNFICQAIKDGIIGEVIWIVPDGSWISSESRQVLRRHIKRLAVQYSGKPAAIAEGERRFSALVGKTPLTVCALDTVPEIAAPILLDIDTDFMTLPLVSIGTDGTPGPPWIWPEELAAALRRHGWNSKVETIAYSVDGGYTPIEWKWLGDALACALNPAGSSAEERAGFAALTRGAKQRFTTPNAATELRVAANGLPKSGAPLFALALSSLANGDIPQARRYFDAAANLDASYRGPFGCRGLACLNDGRIAEAKQEFDRFVALDPQNAFVELGRGRIAIHEQRWQAAESHLRRAIELAPRLVDAHRYLGDSLVHLGKTEAAAAPYARSLRLALEGERSLEELQTTESPARAVRHGRHGYVHAALARVDANAGRIPEAIAGFQMAIAAGNQRAGVSHQLAMLLFRTGRWRAGAREFARAVSLVPFAIKRAVLRR